MELQLDDIRDSITLNSIHKLRDAIIDCAKNIKSNDATFQISTLPTVTDKLYSLMDNYAKILKETDTCQQAFLQIHDQVEQEEDEQQDRDFIDLDNYLTVFKRNHSKAKSAYPKSNPARKELARVISPQTNDEEIQVEAPMRQSYKDPITKKDIRVAVRSRVCKHIFDKDSIEDYIRQSEAAKVRIKCPLAGCTNKSLTREELELDVEINQIIQTMV